MFSGKGQITRQKKIDISAGLNSSGQTPFDSFSSRQDDASSNSLDSDKDDDLILTRKLNELNLKSASPTTSDSDNIISNNIIIINDDDASLSLNDFEKSDRSLELKSSLSNNELLSSHHQTANKHNPTLSIYINSERYDPNSLLQPSINTKTITTLMSNSHSKVNLSTALKERLLQAKSSNSINTSGTCNNGNGKHLMSNNSVPVTQAPKQRRLANLMRLSYQAGSFFSRSCPGEEITQQTQNNDDDFDDDNQNNNNTKLKVNNNHLTVNGCNGTSNNSNSNKTIVMKQNSVREETSTPHHLTNHQKITKSLLSFANRAGLHTKNKKSIDSNSSSPIAGGSISSSVNGIDEHSSAKNNAMIGAYEVDLEKLARELVLPSLNAPLTSFKSNQNTTTTTSSSTNSKPVLQASKTLDVSSTETLNSSKKTITRSLTQNK